MRLAVVVPILIGLCATLASSTSIFLAGDATCADNPNSAVQDVFGWGSYLQYYLDETLAKVVNLAAPASSTRTYIRNGFFADLLSRLSPSDLVLLQFGHDDAVPLDDLFEEHRKRGVVPAVDETYRDILDAKSGVGERVHSFGHYLRQMIQAVREKQAVPILVSPTMTKVFDQRGGLNRTNDVWTDMMYKVAGQTSCAFLDSRNIFADMADPLGVKSTAALFTAGQRTTTALKGADLNAQSVVMALNCIRLNATVSALSKAGLDLPDAERCWRSTGNANSTTTNNVPGPLRARRRRSIEL